MKALLIDLDGVLYEGSRAVPGAADAIAWIRRHDVPHLFLTNTTSRPRQAIVDKLNELGIDADADRILTPPVVATRWLAKNAPGPAALFVAPATAGEFAALEVAGEAADSVASVVVGDYGEQWTFAEMNRAFRLLMATPSPALVALGMTRYWRAEDGLRLDTAPFVMALSHASGVEPVVLGKPAKPFFEAGLELLGSSAVNTVMVGDDIKGDIGGARAAGIAGVLVRTGKFRAEDLDGNIEPDRVIDSIADLPATMQEM